jgi:hypothetical protein
MTLSSTIRRRTRRYAPPKTGEDLAKDAAQKALDRQEQQKRDEEQRAADEKAAVDIEEEQARKQTEILRKGRE